jgi:hypothetical protein
VAALEEGFRGGLVACFASSCPESGVEGLGLVQAESPSGN